MARSQIPVTTITRAGATPPSQTTADATNNHYIEGTDNTGEWFLEVISSDAGSQSVTVVANPNLSSDGLTVSNLSITIAAGVTRLCGPFKPNTFKQPSDSNRVYVNPSVSTTLKFRAYRLTATP